MSRQLLCAECGKNYQSSTTSAGREILPRSPIGEPAEWERVVRGRATNPTPRTRTMYVNGVPTALPLEYFECDLCMKNLPLGTDVVAVTWWQPARLPAPNVPPPDWEADYLEPAP